MPELHVVLGTGAIGRAIAEELVRRGKTVRMVNRSGIMAETPDGVEVLATDLYDPANIREVTRDAVVVYQSAQPRYFEWPEKFPALQKSIIDGLTGSGVKLVIVENLYMYGETDGKPITEDMPYKARTCKGRVRAQVSEAALAAARIILVPEARTRAWANGLFIRCCRENLRKWSDDWTSRILTHTSLILEKRWLSWVNAMRLMVRPGMCPTTCPASRRVRWCVCSPMKQAWNLK